MRLSSILFLGLLFFATVELSHASGIFQTENDKLNTESKVAFNNLSLKTSVAHNAISNFNHKETHKEISNLNVELNNKFFKIEFEENQSSTGRYLIKNTLAQEVETGIVSDKHNQVCLKNLAAGMYKFIIIDAEKTVFEKTFFIK